MTVKSPPGRRPLSLPSLALLTALSLTSACASRSAPPRLPGAIPSSRPPSASEAARHVADTALRLQGTPYRNGGTEVSGFDCSGLVQYVFAQHGVALPRSVRDQFQAGVAVERTALVPGDLVFFTTTARGATHVGIVVAEDTFVHAPSERGTVRIEHLSADYWARRYVGARRILLP